jgi:glycosyltransferase involved in cell wall biosynthesis
MVYNNKSVFLVGTRWFGVLGPCQLIIDQLISKGYKIYVFGQSDNRYKKYDYSKVKLVSLNVKRSYFSPVHDLIDILKLLIYIFIIRPKSVHSFNPKPSLLCYFSLTLNTKTNFFIGVTGLGNTFIKANNMIIVVVKYFLSNAARRADYVFFQNPDDVSIFKEELGVTNDKIMIFPGPGVDLEYFKIKNNYVKGSTLKVLLVARLLWQKGVDDFITTYNRIVEMGLKDKYQFTLLGDTDQHHPDRLHDDDVRQLKSLGIIWIKWTDDVFSVYSDHDLLLFMSKREGGPRAILEASAVGLPTIGSNCTGVKNLIIDGASGFIVESGDIDSILGKLEKYRADFDLVVTHGNVARRSIAEKYSLEHATKEQMKMYQLTGVINYE